MGFESVQALGGDGGPEILLVPLFGQTRGHCGVAVRAAEGWLLHSGDAYFFRGEMDVDRPHCSRGLQLYQRFTAVLDSARRSNHERLLQLKRNHGGEVQLFCSHDGVELDQLASA
jgi:glyoxylase-like metal-dependent hydrolase (beta-lactamase superfamily II)